MVSRLYPLTPAYGLKGNRTSADQIAGIDNVAIGSLPLQAILQFQPPSRNQAIDYLASLCTKLDIQCEDPMAYMTDLYNRSIVTSSDLIAKPGPPNGNEWLPRFDLRKAIMQLQLERGHCSATDRSITDPPAPEADLNDLARRIDMLSYTDAHLNPKSWAIMEVSLPIVEMTSTRQLTI